MPPFLAVRAGARNRPLRASLAGARHGVGRGFAASPEVRYRAGAMRARQRIGGIGRRGRPPAAPRHMAWLQSPAAVGLALLLGLGLARAEDRGSATSTEALAGRVTRVFDGDSFVMQSAGRPVEVRVFGIDAPERGQPWSKRARARARELLEGTEIVVRVRKARDLYGRVVGEVLLPGGRRYAEVVVGEGLAWQYRRYSKDPVVAALEREAREARRGLWTEKDPEPPWEYRRRKPRR